MSANTQRSASSRTAGERGARAAAHRQATRAGSSSSSACVRLDTCTDGRRLVHNIAGLACLDTNPWCKVGLERGAVEIT